MLKKLRQALLGEGNLPTTAAGVGAILIVVGSFLTTGSVDKEALALALAFVAGGLGLARGAGTGSDKPK